MKKVFKGTLAFLSSIMVWASVYSRARQIALLVVALAFSAASLSCLNSKAAQTGSEPAGSATKNRESAGFTYLELASLETGREVHQPPIREYTGLMIGALIVFALLLCGSLGWSWALRRQVRIKTSQYQKSEATYRSLVEHIPAITYITRPDKSVDSVFISPQVEKILGFTPEDYKNAPDFWEHQLHPEDRERVLAEVAHSYTSTEPFVSEYRMLTSRGQVVWFRDKAMIVRTADGSPSFRQGVMLDITERKQAEEALRKSEILYRAIVEDQTELISRFLLDCTLTFVNQTYCNYFGKTREELIGRSFLELLPVSAHEPVTTFLASLNTESRVAMIENEVIRADGCVRWVQWTDRIILDDQGNFVEFQAVGRDVSETRQRAQELEAIAKVNAALRSTPTQASILPVIVKQLVHLLQADGAAVAMLRPETLETVVEVARGDWVATTGEHNSLCEGVCEYVVASGRAYLNNDVQPHIYPGLPAQFDTLRAIACSPLITQEQTIGALWIGKKTFIAPADVRLLSAISDIAANALYRAALHEQTEKHLHRLAALHEIDKAITGSLSLQVTLDVLLNQVITQLGVHAADILLLNPLTQMLEYAAGQGFQTQGIRSSRLSLGQGHAGRVALERRIIHVPDRSKSEHVPARENLLKAENFFCYYGVPLIAKGRVKGVLEIFHRSQLRADNDWLDFLEALAGQAAISIDNAELFESLQRSNDGLILAYDTTLEGWVRALDLRDKETEGHSQRVTEMTLLLAQAIGLSENELAHIRRGALLHDIGKMAIPDSILHKPEKLTEEEWHMIRLHPVYAYEFLSPIAYLRPALDIPYRHHEKWDGTGYPAGLVGQEIPLSARLFAVTDVWDALSSDRPYRKAWPEEKVRQYLRDQAGKQFDPKAVEVFLAIMKP